MSKDSIIVFGPNIWSLTNFRMELLMCFKSLNMRVIASAPKSVLKSNDTLIQELEKIGVIYKDVYMKRNSLNPIGDVRTFFSLFKVLVSTKPNRVLSYGIKPVIWSGILANLFNIPHFALITGLGFSFQESSRLRKLLSRLVIFLYKISLSKTKAVIFQNTDNRDVFVNNNIIPFDRTHIVDGSGVNLAQFSQKDPPDEGFVFLCVARLLSEKGLREYATAAKNIKTKYPEVEFNLVGSTDPSPDAIPLKEVKGWSGYINFYGFSNDIRPYINNCHVYVLPSYHEGLSRSILEAMAIGRPIITSNIPGCRETILEGVNGFLVPVKSVDSLSERIEWFINNKKKIKPMGKKSRIIVEERYSVDKVNAQMKKILGL